MCVCVGPVDSAEQPPVESTMRSTHKGTGSAREADKKRKIEKEGGGQCVRARK